MDSILVLAQYIIYVIEIFAFWRLTKCLLETKYGDKIHIGSIIIMFLLMFVKHYMLLIPGMGNLHTISSFIIMIYTICTVMFLFKNSFIEKLVCWGVFYFGIIIMELLALLLLRLVWNRPIQENSDPFSLVVMVAAKIITLLFFEWIIRKRKGTVVISFAYYKELAIVIIFGIVLILGTISSYYNVNNIHNIFEYTIIFYFIMIAIITLFMIILILKIDKKSKDELETKLKIQQIELELKLNDDMIDITDKLRQLRHDMNNHLGLIKTLSHAGKYDDLREYIDQIYEDVEVANELVITENKTLAVLLNAKKSMAKQKNIEFQSVIAMKDLKMQNKDICSLLGNILDNAIEAAEKAKTIKYVDLTIQKTETGCIINCENSLGVKPTTKKGKFISQKDNPYIHGIGTENIKTIVEKYKGEVNFDYNDEMFSVRVVMPV